MPSQHGNGRLEAAQRAAGVPAALERLDDAGRALLLLSYRHGMADSEIAARVGAAPDLVATLREEQLEGLVAATGASSREDVIAWLRFVPEDVDAVPAVLAGTAVASGGPAPQGDVWREVKWMVAVLAAFLVLYAAAEFDPGGAPAPVPAERGGAAPRVAVAPGAGEGRAPGGGGSAAAPARRRGASARSVAAAAGAGHPGAGAGASAAAAAARPALGRQGIAGVVAMGGRGPGASRNPTAGPPTPRPPAPAPPGPARPPPAAPT